MKNQLIGISIALILTLGCSQIQKPVESQSLFIGGSESMHETFIALKKDFESIQDSIKINIAGGGSRTGLDGIYEEALDIGLSSYAFDIDEIYGIDHGIQEHLVAYDGITIISNDENPVSALTDSQIAGIFTGVITNWAQVGGDSAYIKPIIRNSNSGTQKFFTSYFGIDQFVENAYVALDNDEIFYQVLKDRNSIGFVGFAYFKVGVSDIMLPPVKDGSNEFYHPTIANLSSGKYPLKRGLRMYFGKNRNVLVDAFLQYLATNRAQDVIEESGVVPRSVNLQLNASID